jgi:hypothetical protein
VPVMKVVGEATTAIQTEEPMSSLKQMSRSTMPDVQESSPSPSSGAPIMPVRGVERNMSSGAAGGRRAPPKRSQSHKIGRPVFDKSLPPEPTRGVSRNASGRLRGAPKAPSRAAPPSRSRSFGRAVPNRSSSTSSLKAYRKQQAAGQVEINDGDSVCDSVFTSASNQTLDSIMLRKKQIVTGGPVASASAMRRPRGDDTSMASFDFDESLHTVDSINLHHRHQLDGEDDQCDLSVFSESFASTDTYCLSDYEDDEEGNIKEVEIEDEDEEDLDEPVKDEPMKE